MIKGRNKRRLFRITRRSDFVRKFLPVCVTLAIVFVGAAQITRNVMDQYQHDLSIDSASTSVFEIDSTSQFPGSTDAVKIKANPGNSDQTLAMIRLKLQNATVVDVTPGDFMTLGACPGGTLFTSDSICVDVTNGDPFTRGDVLLTATIKWGETGAAQITAADGNGYYNGADTSAQNVTLAVDVNGKLPLTGGNDSDQLGQVIADNPAFFLLTGVILIGSVIGVIVLAVRKKDSPKWKRVSLIYSMGVVMLLAGSSIFVGSYLQQNKVNPTVGKALTQTGSLCTTVTNMDTISKGTTLTVTNSFTVTDTLSYMMQSGSNIYLTVLVKNGMITKMQFKRPDFPDSSYQDIFPEYILRKDENDVRNTSYIFKFYPNNGEPLESSYRFSILSSEAADMTELAYLTDGPLSDMPLLDNYERTMVPHQYARSTGYSGTCGAMIIPLTNSSCSTHNWCGSNCCANATDECDSSLKCIKATPVNDDWNCPGIWNSSTNVATFRTKVTDGSSSFLKHVLNPTYKIIDQITVSNGKLTALKYRSDKTTGILTATSSQKLSETTSGQDTIYYFDGSSIFSNTGATYLYVFAQKTNNSSSPLTIFNHFWDGTWNSGQGTVNPNDPDLKFDCKILSMPDTTPVVTVTPTASVAPSVSVTPRVSATPGVSVTPGTSVTPTPSAALDRCGQVASIGWYGPFTPGNLGKYCYSVYQSGSTILLTCDYYKHETAHVDCAPGTCKVAAQGQNDYCVAATTPVPSATPVPTTVTPTPTRAPTPVPSGSVAPTPTPSVAPSVTPTVAPTVTLAPGSVVCGLIDVNGDGILNYIDFYAFSKVYNHTCSDTPPTTGCGGKDTNGDGKIDYRDFYTFSQKYYPRASSCL
jgi:hypothetical protein